jgi:hypothetical protein
VLTCGLWRLEKELIESFDERLILNRLESDFLVSEVGDETVLISDKMDDQLKLRSKLSSEKNTVDAETE